MQVKLSQATRMITQSIKAGLVPMLVGSPASGKSQTVHSIANDFNLEVIDLRLSQCDPTDLLGFPTITEGRATYSPMDTFPIIGDTLPTGKDGWLLFLDEFTSAPPAVQAAAYKLVLDRMVGTHHLHDRVAIVCAGNLETDNAIVEPMSTALQSRLIHMELTVDTQEWLQWAVDNGINYKITSFINFKPGSIYTFDPNHTDSTYAAPRTWEFANRLLKITPMDSPDLLPLLAGTLSDGVAREFITFCRIFNELPTMAEILRAPDMIAVPTEPSILYALTGSISHHMNDETADQLKLYIDRLPIEFQIVCLREAIRRTPSLYKLKAIQKWINENTDNLF